MTFKVLACTPIVTITTARCVRAHVPLDMCARACVCNPPPAPWHLCVCACVFVYVCVCVTLCIRALTDKKSTEERQADTHRQWERVREGESESERARACARQSLSHVLLLMSGVH